MWIISLVITSSSLSGLDCNEEQDVGHKFKQPVVCWPASWQGNERLSDENAHTHTYTHGQSLIQSDSELAVSCYYVVWKCRWTGESQERWMFYVAAKTRRYIFNALCHFPNHCTGLIQDWLQYNVIWNASYSCNSWVYHVWSAHDALTLSEDVEEKNFLHHARRPCWSRSPLVRIACRQPLIYIKALFRNTVLKCF